MTIYLDHAATTPLRTEALNAMLPWLMTGYGNPSSPHLIGRRARAGLDEARERVAQRLHALSACSLDRPQGLGRGCGVGRGCFHKHCWCPKNNPTELSERARLSLRKILALNAVNREGNGANNQKESLRLVQW